MLNIAFANLEWMIALAVLAGSLLGSTFTFLGRRSEPEPESYFGVRANPYGYERPTDWPTGTAGTADNSDDAGSRRRIGWLGGLLILGFGALAGYAGYFSYNSPWDTKTDLRHLVATLHCEAAALVNLSPAVSGAPGYHARNDPDGNGTSCEAAAIPLAVGDGSVARLSNVSIGWPDTAPE